MLRDSKWRGGLLFLTGVGLYLSGAGLLGAQLSAVDEDDFFEETVPVTLPPPPGTDPSEVFVGDDDKVTSRPDVSALALDGASIFRQSWLAEEIAPGVGVTVYASNLIGGDTTLALVVAFDTPIDFEAELPFMAVRSGPNAFTYLPDEKRPVCYSSSDQLTGSRDDVVESRTAALKATQLTVLHLVVDLKSRCVLEASPGSQSLPGEPPDPAVNGPTMELSIPDGAEILPSDGPDN